MSTRSNIAIKNSDGTVTSVYCHSDGYPSHNGDLLLKHYNTEEKVRELLALGDLSYLAPNINPLPSAPASHFWGDGDAPILKSHSFDAPQKGVVIAYGRDRGETGAEARTEPFSDSIFDNDYGYMFENGGWKFCHWGRDWKKLTSASCKEKSTA